MYVTVNLRNVINNIIIYVTLQDPAWECGSFHQIATKIPAITSRLGNTTTAQTQFTLTLKRNKTRTHGQG